MPDNPTIRPRRSGTVESFAREATARLAEEEEARPINAILDDLNAAKMEKLRKAAAAADRLENGVGDPLASALNAAQEKVSKTEFGTPQRREAQGEVFRLLAEKAIAVGGDPDSSDLPPAQVGNRIPAQRRPNVGERAVAEQVGKLAKHFAPGGDAA